MKQTSRPTQYLGQEWMELYLYTTYVFMICTGKLHLLLQIYYYFSTTGVFKFCIINSYITGKSPDKPLWRQSNQNTCERRCVALMKCDKNAYKCLIRKSKIKQFSRTIKNGVKILSLISKKSLWMCRQVMPQDSDEWLHAVNKVRFCDWGQWWLIACCERGTILWLRAVTIGCLLWTRYVSVTQSSDEWLLALNKVQFCDSGQWRVVACSEQCTILWLRAVMSGCVLWTRYDSVTHSSDEWLPAVNTAWFCDSGQWRLTAFCEQGTILWLRKATSGWLLWTRYDSSSLTRIWNLLIP